MSSPATMQQPHHPLRSPLQKLPTFKDPTTVTTTTSPPPDDNNNPLSTFAGDPIFSLFLSPTFSSTQFSSQAFSSGTAASTAEHLHHGIRSLDTQLRTQVLTCHPDLLSQLSSLHHTSTALSVVRSSVTSLQSTLSHLRSEIAVPRRVVAQDSLHLRRLHSTAELLQCTVRVLRLTRKLRGLMGDGEKESFTADLAKAAQLHREVVGMVGEGGIGGIEIVDEEMRWVADAGVRIRSEGIRVLERGLEGFNQAEIGSGLQVFYNLGDLRGTIDGLVAKYKGVGIRSITVALDMKAISGGAGGGFGPGGIQKSGTPQLGAGAKAKDGLWHRMVVCMDELHSVLVSVWHLQKVLSKKRDPFSHVLLLDEVIQETYLRRRDLPTFCRDYDPNKPVAQLILKEAQHYSTAQGHILNTFDDLEGELLSHMRPLTPNLYTVGPLHLNLVTRLEQEQPESVDSPLSFSNSIWQEDRSCLTWLDAQPSKSVLFVSIGSLAFMTKDQLFEFWNGLVNSETRFLWVRRPNSVIDIVDEAQLKISDEFLEGTKERGWIVKWAPQEEVLKHRAIGGFLTHSGWNSTLESIVEGVPMICWPFTFDQQVNSRHVSEVWNIGLDMKDTCSRHMIETMIKDLMDTCKDEFLNKVDCLAKLATHAVSPVGSSYNQLNRLIDDIQFMRFSIPSDA